MDRNVLQFYGNRSSSSLSEICCGVYFDCFALKTVDLHGYSIKVFLLGKDYPIKHYFSFLNQINSLIVERINDVIALNE